MRSRYYKLLVCLVLFACTLVLASPSAASSPTVTASGTMPLLIFNVQSSGITTNAATISWNTNSPSTSQVFYDATQTPFNSNLFTIHSVKLTGLLPSTSYLFKVQSTAIVNGHNFVAISDEFTFTTLSGVHRTEICFGAIIDPSVYRQPVTFYAVVTSGSCMAVPSGTVTFKEGSTTLGTGTLNEWGVTSFTTSSLQAGKNVITAVYGGDSNFAGSTSSDWVQWVYYETTTNLTSTPNPSTFGQSVAFTATVKVESPGTVDPSNVSVTFYDGSKNIGTVGSSGNTAVLNYSDLSAGSHNITAVYTGDTSYAGSTSNKVTQKVNKANTSMTLSTSGTPSSVFGQTVTFTASNTPNTATGSVTFKDGSTTLGTVSLSGGSASISVSNLKVGSHTITASYGGDGNYNSSSNTVSQPVNKANTTTSLANSSNKTITAMVTAAAPGAGTPGGTVTFNDSLGNKTTTVTLSGGKATLTLSGKGTHTITGAYNGDSNFNSSSSNSIIKVIS